ncbi:MAG: hypothetical protein KAS38_02160 [Anaerolineales bacterium]|nr:hypothetical protein [Anaerolineales bacterium]
MKKKRFHIHILLIIAILSILLSGCKLNKVKFGEVRMMFGTNEEGHIAYTCTTFTGIESRSVQAERGQIISFNYQAAISKGSLVIEWQDPAGEVEWRKILVEEDHGKEEIRIESAGKHTILIQGKDAGGKFDVSWQIK